MIQSSRSVWSISAALLVVGAFIFSLLPQLTNGVITAVKAGSSGGYIASGLALAVWFGLAATSLLLVGSEALRSLWIWFRAFGVAATFLALVLAIWRISSSIDSGDLRHLAPYIFVILAGIAAVPRDRAVAYIDRCLGVLTLGVCMTFLVAFIAGWIRLPL